MERRITEPTVRPFNVYKATELLYGEVAFAVAPYYAGYAGKTPSHDTNLRPFISDEMRLDWEAYRSDLTRIYEGEATMHELFGFHELPWMLSDRRSPRPWGAEMFDSPQRSARDDQPH
jgi:hypothetical protein